MHISCLSKASLFAVVVLTLSGGDCSSELGNRRCEAMQDGWHAPGAEKPEYNLEQPPHAKRVTQEFYRAFKTADDVMKLEDAAPQVVEEPDVLRMDREAFAGLDRDKKIKLTKDLFAKECNRLLERF